MYFGFVFRFTARGFCRGALLPMLQRLLFEIAVITGGPRVWLPGTPMPHYFARSGKTRLPRRVDDRQK
jgi:hypothetical protein